MMKPLACPRRGSLLLILLALALGATLRIGAARPVAAQTPDGCDPSEPVACIPLPEEDGSAAPGSAAPSAPPRAAAAPLPAPPVPCPPVLAPPAPATAAAAPLPITVPPGCGYRDVVATVNRGNSLFSRALRTLDATVLYGTWSGQALADLEGQVATLRAANQYGTPRLNSIVMQEVGVGGATARVRSMENWLNQVRSRPTGALVTEQNQWVENLYELELRGGSWSIVRNVITLVDQPGPFPPPPPPTPVISLRVTTDTDFYRRGSNITGTVTNTGSAAVTWGGAYACGPFHQERFTGNGWERAPLPEPLIACPAIANVLRPGESRTQTLPTGPSGIYRLVFRSSAEFGPGGETYSEPYLVR
ncbi:MAG: hypothetical protein U0531_00885 [Dehalococcoidia bacterium]